MNRSDNDRRRDDEDELPDSRSFRKRTEQDIAELYRKLEDDYVRKEIFSEIIKRVDNDYSWVNKLAWWAVGAVGAALLAAVLKLIMK